MRSALLSLFAFSSILAIACGGTTSQTGKDAGGGGDGSSPDTYTKLPSLDAACDGNASLTGRAIVSALKPKYTATYAPIMGGLDGGPTPLTLTISYTNGEVRCYPAWKSCDQCGAPDRPAYVEVIVSAHLTTGDGTFDEAFAPTLDSRFSFNGSVDVTSVKGAFKPAIAGTWDKHYVMFGGSLDNPTATTTGNASEQASSMGSGGVGMGVARGIGSWK